MVGFWNRRSGAAAVALSASLLVALPHGAQAGFLDFLFGGSQQPPTPPAEVNSYAEPGFGRVAPPPMGSENVRQGSSDTGHTAAYCVRLCDGQHFPLENLANATPVETCRAMCPSSKTKVFYGSVIDRAVASDGSHYGDLDRAFLYRKQLVANCTCNGRDAFGLAPFEATNDPTLRPGDIVATKDGYVTFAGRSGSINTFTPIDTKVVEAQLTPPQARGAPGKRVEPPPTEIVEEEPGIVVPQPAGQAQNAPPVVDLSRQPR